MRIYLKTDIYPSDGTDRVRLRLVCEYCGKSKTLQDLYRPETGIMTPLHIESINIFRLMQLCSSFGMEHSDCSRPVES